MNPLSVLILGAGGMGEKHIKAFSDSGRCNIYCFDTNSAVLDRIQNKIAVAGVFTELNTIPADLISAAVIATPTDSHLNYARWCLDHAIPFLIEKPIAIREDGLKDLINDCRTRHLLSGVAFPRRSSAAMKELKSRVSNGDIGTLKLIRGNFAQDFRKYRPDYGKTYYAKLETGGGALMDALSHHINLACYFGGEVSQVGALYDRLMFEGVEGEDCAFINLRFRNGVLGSVHGNQFQKPNEDSIELVGSAGNLRYERLSGNLTWNTSDSITWHQVNIDGDWGEILRMQAIEFLDVIEGVGEVKTSLEEGLHQLQVILAARLSQEKGSIMDVAE
jgi:predicted dehydrogenase